MANVIRTSYNRDVKKAPRFHIGNLYKHDVDLDEAYEALVDGWARRRRQGEAYEVLGRSITGRYLHLMVDELPEELWVFHCREMNDAERRRYQRK